METTQINHSEYQNRIKALTVESLQHIIQDAKAAIAAMPDGHKAGYYADEVHYCSMELNRRSEAIAKTLRFHTSKRQAKQAIVRETISKKTATSFKFAMNIEVVDVGGIPADPFVITNAIKKAVEAISTGDVVAVRHIHAITT